MEKKYQVFVSSTYEDLQIERKKVMEALLQMNCFPVGMEYFNASDSSQWEVIKSLIRECDYYVLIIAGRYGSIEKESGKSYTQKEFEYAIEQGIPVISFVHKDSTTLPGTKLESDPEKKTKLEEFKSDVQKKLCKFWNNPDGLASQVVLSLNSLIKTSPRVGWVKADEISSADANKEILALKKENEELRQRLKKQQASIPIGIEEYQQGNDKIELKVKYYYGENHLLTRLVTWNNVISALTPFMINESSEKNLKMGLCDYLLAAENIAGVNFEIVEDDFQTVKIQLIALGIIEKSEKKRAPKDTETYWTLTSYGSRLMMQLKALKK